LRKSSRSQEKTDAEIEENMVLLFIFPGLTKHIYIYYSDFTATEAFLRRKHSLLCDTLVQMLLRSPFHTYYKHVWNWKIDPTVVLAILVATYITTLSDHISQTTRVRSHYTLSSGHYIRGHSGQASQHEPFELP